MDIKTDFLYGNLKKAIYVDPPVDFVSKGQKYNVCHLKRLYMVLSNLLDPNTLDSMKPVLCLAHLRIHRTILCTSREAMRDYISYAVC